MQPSFLLRLGDLGCFPNPKRPRVIWVGLEGDTAALQSLKLEIDEMLAPLGWSPEGRPFRGHLTLGRVKDARQLRGMSWEVEVEKLVMPVTAVQLIESQLQPSGPIYTLRHSAKLQGQPQE
jgi:2'-5' RNA ligase